MLTEQDRINIEFIKKTVERKPDLQKSLEGPIKWVGEKGFNECVSHLSKKKGITSAKALCSYLKHEARKKGVLARKHMGRLEKQRSKKRK